MNRNDFIRMIEGTHPAERQMTGEVNELIGMFPYFQSAHMLLLKILQDSSDVRFESQLKNSAIYIADREVLYHLLRKEESAQSRTAPEEEIAAPVVQAETVPEEEIAAPAVHAETVPGEEMTAPAVQAETEPEEEMAAPAVAETEPEEEIAAPVVQAETEPEEEMPADQQVDSQQTVIESARNSDDLINEFEKEAEEIRLQDNEGSVDLAFSRSILVSAEADDDACDNTVFVIEDESNPGDERIVYMDPGFSVPEEPDLLELDHDELREDEEEKADEVPTPAEYEERIFTKQLQTDLIDRFISANPRIEASKEKQDQPAEDISRPFVEETGGFVTETLARIYINQGYYSKAIEIYEKLILKFPEKSSYFAAQIAKVKELIK